MISGLIYRSSSLLAARYAALSALSSLAHPPGAAMPPHTEAQPGAPPPLAAATSAAYDRSSNAASPSHRCGPQGCPRCPSAAAGLAADSVLAPRIKSAKRKAAEALLAARYGAPSSSGSGSGAEGQLAHSKRHCSSSSSSAAGAARHVPGCSRDSKCGSTPGWCDFEVNVPNVQWAPVITQSTQNMLCLRIAPGLEKVQIKEGLVVYVVESASRAAEALGYLKQSMKDSVVAIDLEWRPDFQSAKHNPDARTTPVALLQLSSATVAVLFRMNKLQFTMPAVLRDFLQDPSLVLLGFSWDSSDEGKMQRSFGFGRSTFARFLDLQHVAASLGYSRYGLGKLTHLALGTPLPKVKSVSQSNWEIASLTRGQILYAALDVLVAGQVFRALRTWHQAPSECEVCLQELGQVLDGPKRYTCTALECDRSYGDYLSYANHCAMRGHPINYTVCAGCGRIGQLS